MLSEMRTDHSNNNPKIPFEMWTNFLQTTASKNPLKHELITQIETLKRLSETWTDHSNSSPKIPSEMWTNFLQTATLNALLKHRLIPPILHKN